MATDSSASGTTPAKTKSLKTNNKPTNNYPFKSCLEATLQEGNSKMTSPS